MIGIKLAKDQFALSPIYLPSFTPVQGPQARRFANDYTRLFIRYPGLEDSKLGAEGMTGGEKFMMAVNMADAGFNIATTDAGTIGSRTVLAHLPSSDSAYLTGAGLVSTNRLMCSGASLS